MMSIPMCLPAPGDVLDLGLPHRLVVVEGTELLEVARGKHLEEIEHKLLVGICGGHSHHFNPLASSLGGGILRHGAALVEHHPARAAC